MRRVVDFFHRARQRITARVAVLGGVLAIGAVAVWFGVGRLWTGKENAQGPTKQVATGLLANLDPLPGVQPAGATLTDEQMPAGRPGGFQPPPTSYAASDIPAPPTSPYQINPYAPQGDASADALNPYAPSAAPPATAPPANPYRPHEESEAPVEPQPAPYAASGQEYAPSRPAGDTAALPYAAPSEPAPPPDLAPPPAATAPVAMPSSAPGLNPYALGPESSAAPAPIGTSLNPQPVALAGGAAAAHRAAATPGERQLEGPQQPTVTIEKFAPAEIQVGKPATFELVVRNAGRIAAQNVVVTDHVPAGTQLVDARPQPAQGADGSLVWQLGTLQPGEEMQLTLHVMPQTEGEIGSTAHVTFAAQATSRSICTRPQLAIEHAAPTKVLIGESLTMSITVANPGTGPATGVIIEEDVPPGLSHVAGAQLEYEVGTLRPGESKRLELSLRAERPGIAENTVVVRGDGGLVATHRVAVEVVAPQLEVEVNGPKKRFLQRQATYTLSIANPGTAAARDVELAAFLPRGMKFVDSDSQGQYDPAQHAVFWSLEELPPAKAGSVKLTTLPVEPGEQKLRIEGRAALNLAAAGEQTVQVEQSAELLHTVKDADEVIEVGSETTYEIRVANTGTKAATNVQVVALLPAGLKGLAGEGPTRATGDASRIVFEPLARLAPQEEVVFKVQAQGVAPGDHLVRVQLSSDEWPTPVTREESTRVYEDR